MTQAFDKDYWESHWDQADDRHETSAEIEPNPYLVGETGGLLPGTALDAGCGEGTEAIWLAEQGWQVTAVDISGQVLARAAERAAGRSTAPGQVRFIEADLGVWVPEVQFDLVTTHYAHPEIPQMVFYQRISEWVSPGGTLLIVGHRHTLDDTGHPHDEGRHGHGQPPEQASVTAAGITVSLDAALWDIMTAAEPARTLTTRGGGRVQLNDVLVRATRRPSSGTNAAAQ